MSRAIDEFLAGEKHATVCVSVEKWRRVVLELKEMRERDRDWDWAGKKIQALEAQVRVLGKELSTARERVNKSKYGDYQRQLNEGAKRELAMQEAHAGALRRIAELEQIGKKELQELRYTVAAQQAEIETYRKVEKRLDELIAEGASRPE